MSVEQKLRFAIISVGVSALAFYASPQDSKDIDSIKLSSNNTFGPTPDMIARRFAAEDGLTPTATPSPTVTSVPKSTAVSAEVPVWTPEGGFSGGQYYPPQRPETPVSNYKEGPDLQFAQDIFRETNLAREKYGLPVYSFSSELTATAQKYSELLVLVYQQKNGQISHFEDGNPQERALREGYEGGIGENLASYSLNVNGTGRIWVDNWLGSPGHRENILDSDYKDLGVGCAIGYFQISPQHPGPWDYFRICVQNFGQEYEWDGTPGPLFTPTPTPIPTATPTTVPTAIPTPELTPSPAAEPNPTPAP